MEDKELLNKVKENLKIEDTSKDLIISDMIQEVENYCNLKALPISLEPFIRKKVKAIINYENENGDTIIFDIKSIKEGDTSISYNVDEKSSKDNIYGLSDNDKSALRLFRRTRR
ncbi:phage head-tail connector protein [Clostridium sp.]|uniref:phage head-tail connector protein n=1 Tax=Clostridium sp. TaxID=1506 RepID=UPI0029109368|nr:DNA-packaging protein [Clostridium sp.]MDU3526419.1 DNA-packaging protein [Clostridium sp.]